MSVGPLRGEGKADGSVAAAKVEDTVRGRGQRRQLLEQQFRPFIKRAGGEQAVARTQRSVGGFQHRR